MFVAVVGKQVLVGEAAYPVFDIAVDDFRIVFFVAVQAALQRFDVQDEALAAGQAFTAEKQCAHAFDLCQLAGQSHGVGGSAEKVRPYAVAAFFRCGNVVGQHDGGLARTQGFDDLFHALDTGGGGPAFAAHATGLHDGIEGFDFRRFVHGGQREGKLLADVASGQVVAAEVRGNQQQAFARVQGGLDVLPAVHFAKQGFNVFRPSEKGHGQF